MKSIFLFALASSLAIAQPPQQPGTKWTQDQLLAAVAPARAGRKLTPRSWPNGARVAVALSFDVDNESYLLAAGSNLAYHSFGGRFRRAIRIAAHSGFARQISGSRLVLHPGRQRAPASRDDSCDSKKRTERDRRAWLDSRIAARYKRRCRGRAPAESGHRLSD